MTTAYFHTTNLDDPDETEVTVEYSISGGCDAQTFGPPESCYPAEAPEVEIIDCWRSGGEFDKDPNPPKVVLTDAQRESIEQWIMENPPEDDGGFDD